MLIFKSKNCCRGKKNVCNQFKLMVPSILLNYPYHIIQSFIEINKIFQGQDKHVLSRSMYMYHVH